MQSHKAIFKIIVYISKAEGGEGPHTKSTEVIGKFCVYFDEIGSNLKIWAGFLILHDKCCSRERKRTGRLKCTGYSWPAGREYIAEDGPGQIVGLDVWRWLDFQ